MLGLHFCARAFSSCGKRGPLFIAVRGSLTIVASLVAEHRLQIRRLSSCGSWAQPLHGMWDPPRPGLEPASPALAGRLSTTAPPGKPSSLYLIESLSNTCRFWSSPPRNARCSKSNGERSTFPLFQDQAFSAQSSSFPGLSDDPLVGIRGPALSLVLRPTIQLPPGQLLLGVPQMLKVHCV